MVNKNFEGNLTEGAKVVNSAESATAPTVKMAEPARPQRNTTKSQFWAVISKARRTFENQLHKDNAVKLECVEHFIPTITTDAVKFWADYMDEVNVLLDSRKFGKECADLGIDPTTLATHIIFLGVGVRNNVLKNGVKNTIGNRYHMYDKQFLPDYVMKFGLDYEPKKTKQTAEESPTEVAGEHTAA